MLIARVLLAAALSAVWLAAPGDALAPHASRTALTALVWATLVGLPLARGAGPSGHCAAFVAAAAAPALGLAMALERSAGASLLELSGRAVVALVLCACAAWAAQRARGSAIHSALWTALVAGLPLCAALFAWTTGGVQPALATAASWSPLGWLATWAAGHPVAPWGALAASIALLALVGRTAREPDDVAPATGLAPCLVPFAVLVLGSSAAAPVPPFELGRALLAELALEGPLGRIELVTEHGTTRVAAGLAAGETRRAFVPIAGSAVAREPRLVVELELELEFERRGSARLVGVEQPEWAAASAAIGRRALPPLADPTQRGADGVALAALVAATLIALGLRRRPAAVLVMGLASGVLLAGFGAAGRVFRAGFEGSRPVTVYEGEDDAWLAVEVARGVLLLEPARDLWLAVEPRGSRLGFEVELGPPERWRALAPHARLVRRAGWSPPDGWRAAAPAADLERGLGAVERGWRRSSDGLWGPLESLGEARAEGQRGTAPPGWLAAGLPQGQDALVLELAPDALSGGERWLRWVGSLEKR